MNEDSLKAPRESSTFIDVLRCHALRAPEQIIYTFLDDGENETAHLTLAELDSRARAIAALLQRNGLAGERALLLHPSGLDFVTAFLGCLYAKVVAVPTYPPHSNRGLPKLQSIIDNARPRAILTDTAFLPRGRSWLGQSLDYNHLQLLATDDVDAGLAAEWRKPSIDGDTLAFLQYTSGSTAAPKGVMVSHSNLLHNEKLIQTAFRQSEKSVVVGWLPLYHDMGLIGNVLQPLFTGSRCILMPPMAFLQQPLRWLQCVSRYRATTSGGPNFAYELCVRKIKPEQRRDLDLSSWDVAFNGSETVRAETLQRFAEAFKPCGFHRKAFYPSYGLAEATLLVSGGRRSNEVSVRPGPPFAAQGTMVEAGNAEPGTRRFVSCGEVLDPARVVVVDPESLMRCASEQIGELWVSGPSVALGYWNNPGETEHSFRAYLAHGVEGPFLRTGDLGFLHGRELFVTGRLKDLIIIRGRNYYPQDIELTAERCHPEMRLGGGAAFSVSVEDEDRLVLVQEVERRSEIDIAVLAMAIRQAVAEEHDVQLYESVFIRAGTIPKTSSGKIRRHVCRNLYLSGGLRVVGREAIADASAGWSEVGLSRGDLINASAEERRHLIEAYLGEVIARSLSLSISRLEPDRPLISFGIDSLMAMQLKHRLEERLEVTLSFADLLGGSIKTLAQSVLRRIEDGDPKIESRRWLSMPDAPHHPLSHAQRALWFLHQLAPESSAYNLASAVRIRNGLNVAALRSAFQHLVERHPSLRTVFQMQDGAPVQLIQPRMEIAFETLKASRWSDVFLHERLADEAHRPFDLERGPLIRVALFARAAGEHVALLVLHHIIADFRSLEVLVTELSVLYTFYEADGGASHVGLEPLAARYADYVYRQEQIITGAAGEQQWDFWRRQLGGQLPELTLPTDNPRPAVQTYRGASVTANLSTQTTERIKTLGRSNGATLYTTLLAAFFVLLQRYTGQEDVLVGSPTDGRSSPELMNLVGYFVNPVVLRADLSGNQTFVEFLGRVHRLVLESFEHRDFPFALLVERLQPARAASSTPLFQAMFVLEQASQAATRGLATFALGEGGGRFKMGSLDLESLKLEQRAAQFDITLMLAESAEGIRAALQYNTDLFSADTAARMLGHYMNLLASITVAAEQSIRSLSILSPEEQQQLAVEWNNNRRDYPRELLLHELFEAQAEQSPESVAVISGHERLTYGELNARANQLAHHLLKSGVVPETPVGVFMERSPEMLIGLLAVLKAGGAYVPLDHSHPEERIGFMLKDARISLVLTQARLVERLPEQQAILLCLDLEWPKVAEERSENPQRTASAENLSYIIYTSGSTGRPKGVAIEHRSAVTLVHWAGEVFAADDLGGVLASTSICFDLSVFELFVPLGYGGTVILAGNALELPTLPAAREVTLVNTVPSALAELVRNGVLPATVRIVNLAGEPLSRQLVEKVYENNAVRRVFNLYGPSEDTTYSTFALIARGGSHTPPIGRPVANTQVYLLDADMRQVPIGVPGELYLGGEGLSRGYLHRPDLTAERFIPDSFSADPGARLYRTGDLARYLPDGQIEFLGRLDQQIKLRGFRIELGEIETVLRRHTAVREVVVMPSANAASEQRLVAYVVFHREQETTITELRRFAREKLPGYMIPTTFVFLEALPLTPNGKIDRRALPSPLWTTTDAGEDFVAPRTQVEEILAGIWANVLGLIRVSVHHNFFELGGHSLLVVRLVSLVQQKLGVTLPLRTVFEAPTVTGMAEHIEELIQTGAARKLEPLPRVTRGEALALSFAQQRFWFLEQLGARVASYNIPVAMRLTGPLNVASLEQSFQEIVRRHESLRTRFTATDGQPAQIISALELVDLPLTDLSEMPETGQQIAARQLAIDEGKQPFDLAGGRPFRIKLLRLATDNHILLITLHHIVSDEWSLRIILRELATLYEQFSTGGPSPLPELSVQYADYAVWHRQRTRGELLNEELSYWRQQLGEQPATLDLPTDKPRPPVQSFRGATISRAISEELLVELRALTHQQNATLFMTLLAAFKVLLYRYTGQPDIRVGTPIDTRTHPDVESLIGCFVNTLVLRSEVSPELTFTEFLARVRDVSLGGYAHRELPFELIVNELQPERDLSRNPLFQVMFAYQGERSDVRLPGLGLEVLNVDYGVAKCDLTLVVELKESGFVASFEYSTDLFEHATIARMLNHYADLLERITSHPEQRLSTMSLLSEDERRQLLVDWNSTRADYPRDACIHEEFAAQAARTPGAVAVVCGEEQLSYGELEGRANKLARYLRGRGVGCEERVGLLLGRSLAESVAVLGVLKSGAAYVPLDVLSPRARVRQVLAEAGVRVVLTEIGLAELVSGSGVEVVCLDGVEGAEIELESEEQIWSGVQAQNLAYVIYTSGSTAKPKGVLVSHRALVNHSFAVARCYGLQPSDRVLQFASLSFDVAAEELFPSLLNGCSIFLRPNQTSSPSELLRYVTEKSLTVINLPAPYWHELVSEIASVTTSLPPAMRLLIVGSERVLAERLSVWQQIAGDRVRWLNAYGTTETTITSTVYEPPQACAEFGRTSVSIGRPLANTQVYLLDGDLQPVPRGAAGELFIGGDGLARGYLGRPELTAAQFLPHPFSDEPGARLYRTGDLARYTSDGGIEVLGRIDRQVKVRGFRVELGEIETVLQQHPRVSAAVVLARESAAGDLVLAAYLVPGLSPIPEIGELRTFLRERLPEYMLPSTFVLLDELPLTPGGKIDRRELAAISLDHPQDEILQTSHSPVEEVLAGIWGDVLGLERVGTGDSFFELGGHSLLAMRIIARVREAFQIELPVTSLFECPTVAGITQMIETALRAEQGIKSPALRPANRREPPPLSFSQQRLWFLEQLQPGTSAYNIAGAIRLVGRLHLSALQTSLNEITRRHESLRTTFDTIDERPVQVIAPALSVTLPLVDLSEVATEEREGRVRDLVTNEARRPFDLREGPLMRAFLIRADEESHILVLSVHHIISDAWSLAVFANELAALYEAYEDGRESPLAELQIQYADYAVWQRDRLGGDALAVQRAYWRRQLGGEIAALQLPVDHQRPSLPSRRGATHSFALPAGLSESLKALSRREGVTLFMTLLAAFQTQLYRYSGQEDVAVGTDIACRNRVETEGLIGFFINTHVLRTDLSANPRFRELLARVRKVTLDAYTHQDLPFHEVVKDNQPARDVSLNPLFQVMFIMQNAPRPTLSLPGLRLTLLRYDDGSSVFDLSVSMEEDERGELGGTFRYSTDLFKPGTISRMIEHFTNLLRSIVAQPNARLTALEMFGANEAEQRAAEEKKLRSRKFARLIAAKPGPISLSRKTLVRSDYLQPGSPLPLVLQPAVDQIDLLAWATQNRDLIEESLYKHGALLFRDFKVDSLTRFERFTRATSQQLMPYGERSSPRTALGGYVYTSTDHPADQPILLHNEQSYTLEWPMKLWFFCQQPAARRGGTPIADSRNIARRLADVAGEFARRRVMYVRNYGDGLGLPWQEVFQTSERAAVEEHCRKASIEVEWKDHERLRTRQVRPALREHPKTGETVWFNHALFFHISSLEEAARQSLMSAVGEENLPQNTYYGDGSPIDLEVLDRIREAYRRETVSFAWQQGDILMVDNMLVAHGRESFEGPRKIAVVMGEPFNEHSAHSERRIGT